MLVLAICAHHPAIGRVLRTTRAPHGAPSTSTAMHVISIAPAAMERPRTPESATPRPTPRPRPPVVAFPENAVGAEPRPSFPGERLTPRLGDPCIWAAPVTNLSARDATIAHLRESIHFVADSARRVEQDIRRFRDWSLTGADGRRWGFSTTGKLYLGGLLGRRHPTLEFIGATRAAARARDWRAFRNQAAGFQVDTTLDQRIKAIRARKDAERTRSQTAGPPPRDR